MGKERLPRISQGRPIVGLSTCSSLGDHFGSHVHAHDDSSCFRHLGSQECVEVCSTAKVEERLSRRAVL